ncbi:hypothetical protein LTR97_006166 [Elasticomyces elasticus]|uniref:Uncharacterized protein n=1 Tax=Elasticomyces elasticus TaxID=574655 RepID=A0AAN7VSR8_9PEZI|nr:hypothetical protein LTR97_006166 [Elasticomyces elasticus]
MANKGLYGRTMFLIAFVIVLVEMCYVWSAQDGAALRNEVLTPYLPNLGANTVSLIRSGKYSQISVVCGTEQFEWHHGYARTPTELRVAPSHFECPLLPELIGFFDSRSTPTIKRSNQPAQQHLKLYLFAKKHSFKRLDWDASFKFFVDLKPLWQQPHFADVVKDAYATDSSGGYLRFVIEEITVEHYTELFGSDDDHSFNESLVLGGENFAINVSKKRVSRSQHMSLS